MYYATTTTTTTNNNNNTAATTTTTAQHYANRQKEYCTEIKTVISRNSGMVYRYMLFWVFSKSKLHKNK